MPELSKRHLHLVPDLENGPAEPTPESLLALADANTIRTFRESQGVVSAEELLGYAQSLARQYRYNGSAAETTPAYVQVPLQYVSPRKKHITVSLDVCTMPETTLPLVFSVGSERFAIKTNGGSRISRVLSKTGGLPSKHGPRVSHVPLAERDLGALSHILRTAEPLELGADDAETNAPTVPMQLGVMVLAETGSENVTPVEAIPVDTAELDLLKTQLETFLAEHGTVLHPSLPESLVWRDLVAHGTTVQVHLDRSAPSEPLLEYRLEILQRVSGQSKRPKVVKNPETGEVGTAVDLYSILWQGDEVDFRRGVIYKDSANYPAQSAAEAQIRERVDNELLSAAQDPALIMRRAYLDVRKTHRPDTLTPALMTLFETHLKKVLNRS